ncbi:MAG TPA: hypothetical protein VJL29_15750 [Thermoguttaceae bacterium]|nr:hypothetical protein [Thermoguttaceae bacterium]
MYQNEPCRVCSRAMAVDYMVRLWDGQWYCRDCVEAACPGLFSYALKHPRFEESAPFVRGDVWRIALRLEAWIALFFVLLFGAIGYEQHGLMGAIVGIVAAVMSATVQAAVQLPMFVWVTRRMMPTVGVVDGLVSFHRGICKKCGPWTAPLRNFRWRVGRSRQDTGLRNTLAPKQPVVLLLFRRGRWAIFGEERIACGWTEKTRRIWTAFLTLAGVPEYNEKGRG